MSLGLSEKTAFQNFALLKKGEKVKLKNVIFYEHSELLDNWIIR